jgi:heme-degrading monooxygenase HmoA
MIALVFRYDVRDAETFPEVYGPDGEWAKFFRQGAGFIGTELLRDVEEEDRYIVIDRWESIDAYNGFISANQKEYLERSDESRMYYLQELRFGTFENVWAE